MSNEQKWDQFENSGKISDYLDYKKSISSSKQNPDEVNGGENEYRHPGTNSEGAKG